MAIDEAIMLSMKAGESPPTFRLYRWNPSAVSIGTFQSMKDEVDLDYCKTTNIDTIRRITGGGAVFHDYEGEITYSIIVPKGHRFAPVDIIDSYKIICSGIVNAMGTLGIQAEFKPINDVIVNDKKVSGNAQTRRHSCVLQHGTILLGLDVTTMFSILKVPEEKISDKMIEGVKDRVTSLTEILDREVHFEELRDALYDGFCESLEIFLEPGELSMKENEDVEILMETKYSSDEWNLSR
ncbi:MAG: lipoate--protein ligase family protein [Candidatus Thorarchaeota archaeon]